MGSTKMLSSGFIQSVIMITSFFINGIHSLSTGYLILAPAIFRSGLKQSITIRLFDKGAPVLVEASVVNWQEQSTIVSESAKIQGNGILTLQIPYGIVGKAVLQVCGNCHEHRGYRFQNSTTITILNKGTSAFVQTDKPIYKPSQKVQIIVFSVDRDLRPVTANITVYATAPNNVKIVQWTNIRSIRAGVVNVSFPLSDQPLEGEWKIFAVLQGMTYNTTFRVERYVLPKFDVIIIPPPTFRDWSTCEIATVISKYSFGKPVKGRLIVNTTVRAEGYRAREFGQTNLKTWSMDFNGEAKFLVCLESLKSWSTSLLNYMEGRLEISATVISGDGSKFSAYDDSTMISKTYVDFEFSPSMRKYVKRGIPYKGEILVHFKNGTPAENVAIELQAKVDLETFMTTTLISSTDGVISFTIPPIYEQVNKIDLEARIAAVHGITTSRQQYFTKYFDLLSWYSPSDCYLSVEKPRVEMSVNRLVDLTVMSSCPCDFTLYYDLVAKGDIVLSNSAIINASNSNSNNAGRAGSTRRRFGIRSEENAHFICRTSISVRITARMAPVAKLLVYYVRQNGEGVADAIHLPIERELENKVQIDVAERIVSPGEIVPITVRTTTDSCVCLSAIDKSLQFFSSNYILSRETIFDEMYLYDSSNLPFEENLNSHNRQLGQLRRRRSRYQRSNRGNRLHTTHDSLHAFLETGLVALTDIVSLKHEHTVRVFEVMQLQAKTANSGSKIKRKSRKLRAFFPETWYWKCFKVGSSGERTINLRAPDAVTSWVVNAIGVSDNHGIGIASSVEIQAKKKFFVAYNMPYTAIRGEELDLSITVHNYLETCALVRLFVRSQSGVSFPGSHSPDARMIVKYICVDGEEAVTTKVKMIFTNLGNSGVLTMADGVAGPNSCCGTNNKLKTREKEVNASDEILRGTIIAVDALIRNVSVQPEGEKREYTHSVFFCPNEKMNITTVPSTLHFIEFTSKKNSFSFVAKASSSVHVVLSMDREKTTTSYEVVIGGRNNTQSWIQKNDQLLVSAPSHEVLSVDEGRSFWMEWGNYSLTVGYGLEAIESSILLKTRFSELVIVKYIGLGTTGQTSAEFRLWSMLDVGEAFNEVFQLDVPSYAIEGSVKGRASIIGDVMGPTLKNLNNLLKLPYGCGEQNMINFAPNIYILNYLKTTNQLTSKIENTGRNYLIQGYQRQLTYKRPSGSYSAFGSSDEFGSMWLTAFVMKSYSEAKQLIYVDQTEIDSAMKWIIDHQLPDGSFPAYGKIMNRDAQAGINKKIALTAYVAIAILETKSDSQEATDAVRRAIEFLQRVDLYENDPYTAALLAYALTLADSAYGDEARRALFDISSTKNSGSYRFWSLRNYAGIRFDDEESVVFLPSSSKQTVISAEIELAAYALIAFTKAGDVSSALPIVRWISKQRNSLGGFASTQDTCSALQALSIYASHAYMGGVNMNITLEGPDFIWNVHLDDRNNEILQNGNVPSITTGKVPVFVKATGDGCALLQIHVQYNMPDPNEGANFFLGFSIENAKSKTEDKHARGMLVLPALVSPSIAQSDAKQKSSENFKERYNVHVCVRWLKVGSTNMAVIEFPLLTGFEVDTDSFSQDLNDKRKSLKKVEVQDSILYLYFDEIASTCKTCVNIVIQKEFDVVVPTSRYIKIYDYYEPGYESSIAYNISASKCHAANCAYSVPDIDDYPECRCYRECGFDGDRVCGDDGNFYENDCQMSMRSCEIRKAIEKRGETECLVEEVTEQAHPISDPTDFIPGMIYDDLPLPPEYIDAEGFTEQDDSFSYNA